MKFWQPEKISDQSCYSATLGPLQIWLDKDLSELKISESRLADSEMSQNGWEMLSKPLEKCQKPDSTNWMRWIVPEGEMIIKFVPVMPDKPVVVRPESPIQILPGSRALFYVSIPLWLRITTKKDVTLTEIPTLPLSNTWFGEPLTGELCYAVKSKAITNFEHRQVKISTAICPISIENFSPRNFVFQRLSVHTEFLNVYAGLKHLWTNRLEVRIEGDEQRSLIDFSETAPEIEKISGQLSSSREIPTKKLHRRMFSDFPFIKG
jgi:hypothetical protein